MAIDADLAGILGVILQKLDEIKAQSFTGSVTPPMPGVPHVPLVDGEVEVRPTGVNANGAVRYWPATKVFTNAKGGQSGDINYFSYLNRMMETINPVDGNPFCTPGQWANALNPVKYADDPSFQVRADRHMHPADWYTKEEIDRDAKIAAQNAGAPWISGPQVVPTEVPIAGQ
jgi:hypothetical protein